MAPQPLLFNPDLHPMQYLSGNATIELTFDGEFQTFWASQKVIADMFDLTVQAVNLHVQNFKKIHAEIVNSTIKESSIVQREGNRDVERRIEEYNLEVITFIGYRAQVTEKTVKFQRWANEAIRQHLQDISNRAIKKAQHTRVQDITGYILGGKSQAHAEKRVDMKSTIKRLNAIVMELTDVSMIGRVLGREYLLLFGRVADDLKVILHTKNIRDSLPYLQLTYLDTAEQSLIAVLSNRREMTKEELIIIVDSTIKPLADALKRVCEISGIDLVTSKPVLKDGRK